MPLQFSCPVSYDVFSLLEMFLSRSSWMRNYGMQNQISWFIIFSLSADLFWLFKRKFWMQITWSSSDVYSSECMYFFSFSRKKKNPYVRKDHNSVYFIFYLIFFSICEHYYVRIWYLFLFGEFGVWVGCLQSHTLLHARV